MAEFTVTSATRSEKAIDHIPGSVALVVAADIKDVQLVSEDITKVLEEQIPGYSPSRGAMTSFGETLRGRAPLYLIDGIPQSTPLRAVSVGATSIDLAFVGRIEVINGPSATEGLGASGGMINFITKTARKQGTEVEINTKLQTQMQDYSVGWRTDLSVVHGEKDYDLLVGIAVVSHALDYDGHGRPLGIDTQGSSEDSVSRDLIIKLGHNWGDASSQRIQVSFNRFELKGNGNYINIDGKRIPGDLNSRNGIPNSARRGIPIGQPGHETLENAAIQYTNAEVLGGNVTVQLFQDRESNGGPGAIITAQQDPLIAPVGTLVDQAEVNARKYGARTIFVRPDLFLTGLEFDTGVDYLQDTTQQNLILTNRVWVPPLKYSSWSPFGQLEYTKGPLTVRGGLRYTKGTLDVDDFTTILTSGNRTFVRGGSLEYGKSVYNLGAIYRIRGGWAVYASYSEGFQIPDVGVAIRGITVPNQSVNTRADLKAVVTTNHEIGATWRGKNAIFGITAYESYSAAGSAVTFVPALQASVISRVPTDVKGIELNGELNVTKSFTVGGSFSKMHAKTAVSAGLPLDINVDASKYPPPKFTAYAKWAFSPNGALKIDGRDYLSRHTNVGRVNATGASLEENFHGYALADLSVSYKTRFGTFALGIENIFDTYYLQLVDSSNTQTALTPTYFFSGRGRSFSISDSIKF